MRHGVVRHLHDAEQSPMFLVANDPVKTFIAEPAVEIGVVLLVAGVHHSDQPTIMAVSAV